MCAAHGNQSARKGVRPVSQLQRLLNEAERLLASRARAFASQDTDASWQQLRDAAVSYATVLEVDQERRYQAQLGETRDE